MSTPASEEASCPSECAQASCGTQRGRGRSVRRQKGRGTRRDAFQSAQGRDRECCGIPEATGRAVWTWRPDTLSQAVQRLWL